MKSIKFIFPVLTLLLSLLVACNKNLENDNKVTPSNLSYNLSEKPITIAEAEKLGVYDDDSQDIEIQSEDVKLPLDLNTRSATMSISSITSNDNLTLTDENDTDGYGNNLCGNAKYTGLAKMNKEAHFKIRGNGFGASRGTNTVTLAIGSVVYNITDYQSWVDTLIHITMNNSSPIIDKKDLKAATVKFTVSKAAETVTKSIKVLGDYTDENRAIGWYNAYAFGQSLWNVANERSKMGKAPFMFTTSSNENSIAGKDGDFKKITPYYVPAVGDFLFRARNANVYNDVAAGISEWNPEWLPMSGGIVMEVSDIVDNVRTVTVWEMNLKCTGALQKKKYKYLYGLFVPKKGEGSPFYGYGR